MKCYSVIRAIVKENDAGEKVNVKKRSWTGAVYNKYGKLQYRLTFNAPPLKLCSECETYCATTTNGFCNYCSDRPIAGMKTPSRRLKEIYPNPEHRPNIKD